MVRIINCDSVSLVKDGKIVLDNLTFSVEKGSFVSIVGNNGSGKSSLINVLAGIQSYNGYININGYSLEKNNMNEIRKSISVVLSNMDNLFIQETVLDELIFSLKNIGKDEKFMKNQLDQIINIFGLKNILNKSPFELNNSQRQMLIIACALISSPDVLIMDECMHQLSVKDKRLVLDILNSYRKKRKITIIMSVNDIEDVVYSDRIIVLDNGRIIMDGSNVSVLKNQDKMLELGIGLPFVMNLSLKLMKRGIVSHVYLDMRKMVDDIWK